ncbi:unnamed protein product [Rangifer tarandus platyrhynchus]|uniref:Uncharacterized protein n=1 Tax=Rangifer tarandus platyrhynchus TaxID=3082113 RepID=A0AC59Z072_RANTA
MCCSCGQQPIKARNECDKCDCCGGHIQCPLSPSCSHFRDQLINSLQTQKGLRLVKEAAEWVQGWMRTAEGGCFCALRPGKRGERREGMDPSQHHYPSHGEDGSS